ncbi:MAG: hypothetical protein J5869_02255 [Bacteroidaceae bacterium]|nr:hypothetical protein [Bacteroidaceae bacterium]
MKKKTLLILIPCIILSVLSSCVKDEQIIKPKTAGFVNCHTDSEGYVSVLTDDMGNSYMVSEKGDRMRPDTTYRMVCSYTFQESGSVTIDQMVPTYCGVIGGKLNYRAPEENAFPYKEVMNDPADIELAYAGSGFLNIRLGIKVGSRKSSHEIQVVHVHDTGRVRFRVYHNAAGDEEGYTLNAYLSVPLTEYGLSRGDSIYLSSKGYDKDYDLVMVY